MIFGGPRGDIAITEHDGAAIGEAVAVMSQSAVLDLSELGTKAKERRFMLHFLTALYRKAAGELLHVVFDEADMWAPQNPRDTTGGDVPKLLGQMETIVRRGRVKGFIPWLITQRPAVLSKDILSQVDGLIAFKLTSSHDRKALGATIEGQAGRDEQKQILATLPALERGTAVVWLPARDVLHTAPFPAKVTFDSSATPKRGEKRSKVALKPLDVDALRARLADVEARAKADDPAELRRRIRELERELLEAKKSGGASEADIAQAHQHGYKSGAGAAIDAFSNQTTEIVLRLRELASWVETAPLPIPDERRGPLKIVERPSPAAHVPNPARNKAADPAPGNGALTGPQRKVLQSLRFWESVGYDQPSRVQVAAVAGYSAGSGNFQNVLGGMKAAGLIDYPVPGTVCRLSDGETTTQELTKESAADNFAGVVKGPGWKVLKALAGAGEDLTREILAVRTDYSAGSGNFQNILGRLRTLEAIDYPTKGMVRISPWAEELVISEDAV